MANRLVLLVYTNLSAMKPYAKRFPTNCSFRMYERRCSRNEEGSLKFFHSNIFPTHFNAAAIVDLQCY
jgi:hypothetical protein